MLRSIIVFIAALFIAAVAIYHIFKNSDWREVVGTVAVSFALAFVAFAWGWFVC